MKKRTWVLMPIILAIILSAQSAWAAPVPPHLTYQGHLLETSGVPVPDGDYALGFSLWDAPSGGSQLWGPEAHSVATQDGFFSVRLGTTMPLDPTFLTEAVYVEINIAGETLRPRQQLASVAFALAAADAQHATDTAYLEGHPGAYYREWANLVNVPPGFADGVDNDTIYTDVDALSAVEAAGYLTTTSMLAALNSTTTLTVDVAHAAQADDAHTLQGQGPDYYLDWANLHNVPLGFADGVDNDTVYTDSAALAAVAAAGYLNETTLAAAINQAGETLTVTHATTAGDAATLNGQTGAYYLDWANFVGVPADLQDGDADTTYSAGAGLVLEGTQFSAQGIPYAQVVIVAHAGGDFDSLQAAVDSITDATADSPYLVWIAPGVYSETVTLTPHIHVQGAGQALTVLTSAVGSASSFTIPGTLTVGDDSTVRELAVHNTSHAAYAAALKLTTTTQATLADVTALVDGATYSYGLYVDGTGELRLENLSVTAQGAYAQGLVANQGAVTARGGHYHASSTNTAQAALAQNTLTLQGVTLTGHSRNGAARGITSYGGDVTVQDSRVAVQGDGALASNGGLFGSGATFDVTNTEIRVTGGLNQRGLEATNDTVADVQHSRIHSAQALRLIVNSTVRVGSSQLAGAIDRGTGTTLRCVYVYNANYVALACP